MGRWEKHVGYSVCSHQFYMFVRLKVGYPPQLWPCREGKWWQHIIFGDTIFSGPPKFGYDDMDQGVRPDRFSFNHSWYQQFNYCISVKCKPIQKAKTQSHTNVILSSWKILWWETTALCLYWYIVPNSFLYSCLVNVRESERATVFLTNMFCFWAGTFPKRSFAFAFDEFCTFSKPCRTVSLTAYVQNR